jgi:hypothetical protein
VPYGCGIAVDTFPSFRPPPLLSYRTDPSVIKANLSSLDFKTQETNLDAYLELMKLLMSKLLVITL